MKHSIFAVALAALAVASFAHDRYSHSALQSERSNVGTRQLADAEEWRRSRPGAGQDTDSDSSIAQG
jgi:hypothetical protein